MDQNDPDKEWLTQRYDMLAKKFNEQYQAGRARGREAMEVALENAREQLTSLGEFSAEQGTVLKDYLERDMEQTIEDAQKLGEEAKEIFHPSRLGAGALASLAAVLEMTGNALDSLTRKTKEALTYKTGEITSAGSLTCQACGQKMQLKKTGHIPPCPKCSATLFHKGY